MTTVRTALRPLLMKPCSYSTFPPQKLIQILSMLVRCLLRSHHLIALGREKSVRESGRAGPAVEVSVSSIPMIIVRSTHLYFRRKLSKMAFKRVLKAKTAFKTYSAKLSPEVQKEWEKKFTEKGLFQLREQTAQVRRLPLHFSLTLSDRYVFLRWHRSGVCIVW